MKHGHAKRDHRSSLYGVWCTMKTRCNNPKFVHFANYGGRGISVCDEWNDFETFAKWAQEEGYERGLIIDRKNNELGYCPDNCRWVDRTGSNRNRRSVIYITAFGESKVRKAWSSDPRCVVPWNTLRYRLENGWPPEAAMVEKANSRPRRFWINGGTDIKAGTPACQKWESAT